MNEDGVIGDYRKFYERQQEALPVKERKPWKEMIEYMSRKGVYGNTQVIQCFAYFMEVNIIVFTTTHSKDRPWTILQGNTKKEAVPFLFIAASNEIHFQSVLPSNTLVPWMEAHCSRRSIEIEQRVDQAVNEMQENEIDYSLSLNERVKEDSLMITQHKKFLESARHTEEFVPVQSKPQTPPQHIPGPTPPPAPPRRWFSTDQSDLVVTDNNNGMTLETKFCKFNEIQDEHNTMYIVTDEPPK